MSFIRRIGYRHLDAVKFQVFSAMSCSFADRPKFYFKEWLMDQFPAAKEILKQEYFSSAYNEKDSIWEYRGILNTALMIYESNSKDEDILFRYREGFVSSSLSDHCDEDMHGSELAGFWDYEQFIIRSGIVASLGVLEEFERGVLRILFQHRENSEHFIDKPRLNDFLYECETWLKIKKNANAVDRRRKMFKEFNIKITAQEPWFTRLSEIRNKRHLYAHGMGAPHVIFQDFIECQQFVYKNILLICRNTHRATGIEI